MTRIGRLAVFLLVAIMFAGCGGDNGSGDQQASRRAIPDRSEDSTPAPTAETTGRQAIPPEGPEAVEGLLIAPFFDAEGTKTEMAVAPREIFTVYICIQHPGYDMTTAQWRMEIPDGITVLGEKKVFERALSIGTYSEMYIITYPCQSGGSTINLVQYSCLASEEFQGGEFVTVKADGEHGHGKEPPFIGFVTCGDRPEQVPSYGGSATLTRK